MYDKIKYWAQNYGRADCPDQRAVEDFLECESREFINTFRSQLYAVSQGKYEEDIMGELVGKKREAKHGTYEDWAKLMLLWIANYKG